MARCWTCGADVSGSHYTCQCCPTQLKSLQGDLEGVSQQLDHIEQVQLEGFAELSESLASGLSEIASAIEWGFGEVVWQLEQQTDVLRSIDLTLKTPGETQANEWRKVAEELRRRGVLEESEQFYLRAVELNPLDYRIYVGLAETYLQGNKFDKAQTFLEKSLPHAPRKEIDYRSYSYRLIGHIYACAGNYDQAVAMLQQSIELSPTYADGHYDYAQYSAQKGNTSACLSSLQKAALGKPLYYYLAQSERNFDPVRREVHDLLKKLSTDASKKAKGAISKAETALEETDEAVSKARAALNKSRDRAVLECVSMYEEAEAKLKLADDKAASRDYVGFLEAVAAAEECRSLTGKTIEEAKKEQERHEMSRNAKVRNAWRKVPSLLFYPLAGGFGLWVIFSIGSCMTRFVSGQWDWTLPYEAFGGLAGFLIGIIGGLAYAIYEIQKELE